MALRVRESLWATNAIRIGVPVGLTVVLFVYSIVYITLPTVEANMMASKRELIRELAETSSSLLANYQDQVASGELTLDDAQARAKRRIRAMRYGTKREGYFWIMNTAGRMLMHAQRPELENTDTWSDTDPTGKRVTEECVRVSRERGAGYIQYEWYVGDSSTQHAPKISYVTTFKPWRWIIGTGVHLQDINEQTALIASRLWRAFTLILLVVLALSAYIVWQGGRGERKRRAAEQELRDSERRFHALFDHAFQLFGLMSPDGVLLAINRAALDFVGLPESELRGKLFWETPWWTHSPEAQARLKQAVHEAAEGRFVRFETSHYDHQGRLHAIDFSLKPVADESGQVTLLIPEGRDISERKRAEEERMRLTTAVEQAVEAVAVVDPGGVIEYVNPAFESITGYSREEAIGRSVSLLHGDEPDEAFDREAWEQLARGEAWQGLLAGRRRDGASYKIELTISPVRDASGAVVNGVAVARDVTREEELESRLRQAQRMESIGRLAGGVAHDLNNMLTPILGYAEMLLLDAPADDPKREHVEQMHRAARQAADITRQLLAFSRKQVLDMKTIRLDQVVRSFEQILRRTIREDIELVIRLAPDLGCIQADSSQIEQVLMNLAANAQDAMPDGGKMIIEAENAVLDDVGAGLHPGATPGPCVMLSVSDTGTGMDSQTQRDVFEPFFTTKEHGQGTGLGLATVYGIVKQHNGHVWVYSEPGKGATFRISFARVDEAAAEASPEPIHAAAPRGGETVLVVEDDEAVRRVVCAILEQSGYDVLQASGPNECLDLMDQHERRVELLLTDVIMPGMNGKELYESLLPQRPDLKVLYMSGYTDDIIAHHGILDKDVHFVQKPVSVAVLTRKVRESLDACSPAVRPSSASDMQV